MGSGMAVDMCVRSGCSGHLAEGGMLAEGTRSV